MPLSYSGLRRGSSTFIPQARHCRSWRSRQVKRSGPRQDARFSLRGGTKKPCWISDVQDYGKRSRSRMRSFYASRQARCPLANAVPQLLETLRTSRLLKLFCSPSLALKMPRRNHTFATRRSASKTVETLREPDRHIWMRSSMSSQHSFSARPECLTRQSM